MLHQDNISVKKIIFVGFGLGTRKPAGIHRNTLELLKELDKLNKDKRIAVIIPSNEAINYKFKNIEVIKRGYVFYDDKSLWKILSKISRFVWKNITLQLYLKAHSQLSVDMLLCFPIKPCDVVALYDCIPERMKQYYVSSSMRRKRRYIIKRQQKAIESCKVVFTDSEYAKNDIIDFYGVDSNKCQVIYCAWQHFKDILESPNILNKLALKPKQYFFSMGSRFPHKNIKWISCAAQQNPQYKFVVSGQKSSFEDTSFEGEIPENMLFCGYLTDSEVKSLMKNCKAFIQPSFYEGFGIPPMEAMSVGAKCIVSNVSSLPEVYMDSVWYIDPNDYQNVDLDKIMERPTKSNDIILKKYSWENSAKKMYNLLLELSKSY